MSLLPAMVKLRNHYMRQQDEANTAIAPDLKYMEELIRKAKQAVCKRARIRAKDKQVWTKTTITAAGQNPRYRIDVFTLDGTPLKGIVYADYYNMKAKAYTGDMKHIHTFG